MTSTPQSTPSRTARWFGSARWMRWATLLAIGILVTAVGVGLPRGVPMLGWYENWLRDGRISLFGQKSEPRTDIAVLAIKEQTLDVLPYRSPIDRAFLADVLRFLQQAKVRGVVIDILFDKATEPAKDAALRQIMLHFPVPLVVAWGDVGAEITEQQHAFMTAYLDGIGKGYGNLVRDQDGFVRQLNARQQGAQDALPTLPAAMAEALGVPPPKANQSLDYLLDKADGTPAIPSFPAEFVVPRKDGGPAVLPPAFFTGKIVLIGADLLGQDRFHTPLSAGLGLAEGDRPGVMVHAQSLAQILDGRHLKESGLGTEIVLVALASALGLGLATLDVSLWVRLGGAVFGLMSIWLVLVLAYPWGGYLLPVISPGVGFLVAVTATSFYQQRRYLQERTFIRGALSRYVAEGVVSQLEAEPWRLKLGGERRELTFLFTDIAGFTTLSETAEPTVLVAALNAYLDGASQVVKAHNGTIDKYIGDALVAYFGAFSDDGKHPAEAVACALAIDAFAERFALEQRQKGLAFGMTRVGVNSGSAIIGNFGGEERMDYTAIGDTVNTASRLEGANKYLGTRVCAAASTAAHCPDQPFRPAARLFVKGRHESIDVLEPLGAAHPALTYRDAYAAAYAMLQRGEPAARDAFERLRALAPDDALIRLHVERIAAGASGVEIELEGK
jgi:class 3 adenylate cyclase/CHASE2 domain-containing sensor protein